MECADKQEEIRESEVSSKPVGEALEEDRHPLSQTLRKCQGDKDRDWMITLAVRREVGAPMECWNKSLTGVDSRHNRKS